MSDVSDGSAISASVTVRKTKMEGRGCRIANSPWSRADLPSSIFHLRDKIAGARARTCRSRGLVATADGSGTGKWPHLILSYSTGDPGKGFQTRRVNDRDALFEDLFAPGGRLGLFHFSGRQTQCRSGNISNLVITIVMQCATHKFLFVSRRRNSHHAAMPRPRTASATVDGSGTEMAKVREVLVVAAEAAYSPMATTKLHASARAILRPIILFFMPCSTLNCFLLIRRQSRNAAAHGLNRNSVRLRHRMNLLHSQLLSDLVRNGGRSILENGINSFSFML